MSDSPPGSSNHSASTLVAALRQGGHEARGVLFEHVYSELRERAQWQRARWQGDLTLNTTALVNEAYLKLVRQEDRSFENRSHFLGVAARAMRHILINYARQQRAQKRGGEQNPVSLEDLRESLGRDIAISDERAEVLLALDEALTLLEHEHPRASQVVECRFFGGMSIEETAEAVGIATATVSRDWALAQAWLYRAIQRLMD